MNRASPADLRHALEVSQALTKAGILFVPMPALSAEDYAHLAEQMEKQAEDAT